MKFYLSALSLILLSYFNVNSKKDCKVSIFNNTDYYIDSIKITSYSLNYVINKIPAKKKIDGKFSIEYSDKYKGAFLLTIYVQDSIRRQTTFGYFSSGNDIKSKYSIEIYDDFSIKEKND